MTDRQSRIEDRSMSRRPSSHPNPYLGPDKAPFISELISPLPSGAHILGKLYRPGLADGGESSRGSSRLRNVMQCPLKAKRRLDRVPFDPQLRRSLPAPIDVGTVFHLLAARTWAHEAFQAELIPRLPDWVHGSIRDRAAVDGIPAETVEYTELLFRESWPRIKKIMPLVPLVAEREFAATLGELVPGLMETDPDLGLEVITARADVVSFLRWNEGVCEVSVDDYKTRASHGGRLPRRSERDHIDFQAALYSEILRIRLSARVCGFTHVRVERVPPEELTRRPPAIDRHAIAVPPMLRRSVGLYALSAVRTERAIASGRSKPIPLGMATGICYGGSGTGAFRCEYLSSCVDAP